MHDCRGQEVWTVAWTSKYPEHNVRPQLVSGGDDSVLCGYPLHAEPIDDGRSHEYDIDDARRDKTTHTAGVTALLPLVPGFHSTQLLLTGSYDDHVRLLWLEHDHAQTGIAVEKELGGGVWSLRQLYYSGPKDDLGPLYLVLASCMHAGPKLLMVQRNEDEEWEINVVAKNVEHESMNYASAGRPIYGETGLEGFLLVSTSFYDKKFCVWPIMLDQPEQ